MTHLTSDELRTWYEQGSASDRARVIGHLAECETCRKALSAVAMAAKPAGAEPVVSIDDAVKRGYAARSVETPSRPAGWLRPLYGLAAAAVVVAAVMWVTSPQRIEDDGAVRSSEISGITPVGDATLTEFRFASPFQAASYRLTVRDASGAIVLSTASMVQPITVDQSMRNRLVAGQSYSWVVTALDRAGDTIAESKPLTFRYRP